MDKEKNKEEKLQNHIDAQLGILRRVKDNEEKSGDLKNFTNNQKRFQYDYEEDIYEPASIYDDEDECDEYDIYDQDEDGTKYPRIPK